MKLPRNLSNAVTGITGGRKGRRAERKAQRIADKGGALKKQIADAQARTELPAADAGAARERMLRDQNEERSYAQLETKIEQLTERLSDAWLTIDEIKTLQQLSTDALEQVTGALERTEKAVNELSKRLGEACLTIDESLSGLDERVTPVEVAVEELTSRLDSLSVTPPEPGSAAG